MLVAWALTQSSSARATEPEGPRVFLNCAAECFETFLRQELSAFTMVRDRHAARYEILIAAQPSGGGGTTYSVTLFTREEPSSLDLPGALRTRGRAEPAVPGATRAGARTVTWSPGQSPVDFRAQLLDAILRVLYAAVIGTPDEARFELTLPARDGAMLDQVVDSWDHWVIMPELKGEGEGGSGYYSMQLGAAVTARRITNRHKLRLRANYWRSLSAFEFEDGSEISGDVYGFEATALYARSLGEHFAVGLTSTVRSSEYENQEVHVHYAPVVEWNAFPYAQNSARQLRFDYQLGVWYNDYFELNVLGELSDVRYYHALSAIADVNQSWGSVQVAAQLNSFVAEPSLFRLAFGGQLTLLLVEGLSAQFEGTSAWVKDQVNARQRPLEDSEIILFTAEQPTTFVVEVLLGLSYAFGSVHNTIVNPRFGRVDLAEE